MAESGKLFKDTDLPGATTPAMRQYHRFKRQHSDALLLFRMGDFYETFYDDAKLCARVCGLALTSRSHGGGAVPLAGFPYHALETYLKRLVAAGVRVAVCEQVQDPREAKGIVERDVVRVVTPGTLTEETLLEAKANNFLAAVVPLKDQAAIAWVDLSTGRFLVLETGRGELLDELGRIGASEYLIPDSLHRTEDSPLEPLRAVLGGHWTPRPDWAFEPASGRKTLLEHFRVASLEGFGCGDLRAGLGAAGAVLEYLQETQKASLDNITRLERFSRDEFLVLDKNSQVGLELLETLRTRRRDTALLGTLDATLTPMGGRLFRQMLLYPLRKLEPIRRRQQAVAQLVQTPILRDQLRSQLRNICDIERLASKIAYRRANPRDLAALRASAHHLPQLRTLLADPQSDLLQTIRDDLDTLDDIRDLLTGAIVEEPPTSLTDGGIIRTGYSPELDTQRAVARDGKSWLARFQAEQIEKTGIESLKVGYNRVFGYYIEITNAHADKVPPHYTRKQTLKNAERYITPELKDWEERILGADERARSLEHDLFCEVRETLAAQVPRLLRVGALIAQLDALASLAHVAAERGYCMPEVADDLRIEITDGRHPVLEVTFEAGRFVPNDTLLDGHGNRIAVITGPNMAGKSTYIRQVALLVLMAQMGSFIPARKAHIGVADRIFTRVGASDELARGQSTFMVEMLETASILNNATDRSLLILDEVGRGTSTFDGVSIAWAVSEYIHTNVRARTLFATHYHELTELALLLDGVRNYNIAVREWRDEIVFLHKIVQGGSDKSYGIHVARLAGVPREVLERAKVILANLEAAALTPNDKPRFAPTLQEVGANPTELQLTLFGSLHAETIEKMKALDINSLTPLEALSVLEALQGEIVARERNT